MGLPQLLEFTGRNKINLYAKGDIQDCVKLYNTVSKLAYISFRVTFDQKEPEDVTELEELRSWDHELHFTNIQGRVKMFYTVSKLAYIVVHIKHARMI